MSNVELFQMNLASSEYSGMYTDTKHVISQKTYFICGWKKKEYSFWATKRKTAFCAISTYKRLFPFSQLSNLKNEFI